MARTPKSLAKSVLRRIGVLARPSYWERRKHLRYTRYVQEVVRIVERKASSAIDVGSYNTPIIEDFDWIKDRVALDRREVYSSANVKGVVADFFEFAPLARYDLAICLQVLEHIPDAERFAQKLFEVADRVLITVPYMWPAASSKWHVHDPVDFQKLHSWTHRKPTHQAIIQEMGGVQRRRLLAYYRPTELADGENIALADLDRRFSVARPD